MKGKKNYCKSKHFWSYCSLPIVNSRANKDSVHTKAVLVWLYSFEVKITRTECLRVTDVSENWQRIGQKGEFYALHFSSKETPIRESTVCIIMKTSINF